MSKISVPITFKIIEDFTTDIDVEDLIEAMSQMNVVDRINLMARQMNDLDFHDLQNIEDLSQLKIIASWHKRQEHKLLELIKNRQNPQG